MAGGEQGPGVGRGACSVCSRKGTWLQLLPEGRQPSLSRVCFVLF